MCFRALRKRLQDCSYIKSFSGKTVRLEIEKSFTKSVDTLTLEIGSDGLLGVVPEIKTGHQSGEAVLAALKKADAP